MTEPLLEFGKKAEGADVALFFYAGHGIAVNGTNYLLPVDADLKSEMDVKLGAAINIDVTLGTRQKKAVLTGRFAAQALDGLTCDAHVITFYT
jgi:uncharacterized caspase-like protein